MIPLHDDNPTRINPLVTFALIGLCVVAFLYQVSLPERAGQALVLGLGTIPAVLFGEKALHPEIVMIPETATLVTSMFLHGGWMHLLGNMLYLWIFGNNVEDAMGHRRFVVFYLACGVLAALSHALPNAASEIPMIGASGAISGVLGAYLLLYPRARVLVAIPFGIFIHTMRLPAVWVLGFWFVFQILNSVLSSAATGGVAWGAHIGGFIAGMVLIPVMKRRDVRFFAPRRTPER